MRLDMVTQRNHQTLDVAQEVEQFLRYQQPLMPQHDWYCPELRDEYIQVAKDAQYLEAKGWTKPAEAKRKKVEKLVKLDTQAKKHAEGDEYFLKAQELGLPVKGFAVIPHGQKHITEHRGSSTPKWRLHEPAEWGEIPASAIKTMRKLEEVIPDLQPDKYMIAEEIPREPRRIDPVLLAVFGTHALEIARWR
jgi:hypothetical protein